MVKKKVSKKKGIDNKNLILGVVVILLLIGVFWYFNNQEVYFSPDSPEPASKQVIDILNGAFKSGKGNIKYSSKNSEYQTKITMNFKMASMRAAYRRARIEAIKEGANDGFTIRPVMEYGTIAGIKYKDKVSGLGESESAQVVMTVYMPSMNLGHIGEERWSASLTGNTYTAKGKIGPTVLKNPEDVTGTLRPIQLTIYAEGKKVFFKIKRVKRLDISQVKPSVIDLNPVKISSRSSGIPGADIPG